MLPRTELASTSRKASTVCAGPTVLGFIGWRREKVSSWRVSASPRAAAARSPRAARTFFGLLKRAQHGLGVAVDDHQQVVEIVRDAAGELAERFHLLRLRQLLLRALERELRPRGAR